jgi:rod shape-determining protein MreB and related proteins
MLSLFSSSKIAVDLGTANTLVYVKGKGIVLNEPSMVAVEKHTRKVIAVGREAKNMYGRTHDGVQVIRPMRDGVIADIDLAEIMLRQFLVRAMARNLLKLSPTLVIGVPSSITQLERRAVLQSARSAGAKEAYMIAEPIAAAIGVGLPVRSPQASLICDIGGGTSEVCVLSMSGIVADASIRVGGDEMDEAIVTHMRRYHKIAIGEMTGEQLKIQIGSATRGDSEPSVQVRGRDLVSGMPRTIAITASEVRLAIREPIEAIASAVLRALEMTPPELASDIVDRGLVLTGGGALVRGLDLLLADTTGLPIHVDEDPLTCVARGAAQAAEDIQGYRDVLSGGPSGR